MAPGLRVRHEINPRIAQECRTTVSGAISLSASSIARGCLEPAAVEIDDVAAPARCLNLLFGDIISCSLLLRILLFMTYRRSAVGERAAVMDAGGADGE